MSRSARHTHWLDSLVVREDLRGGVGAPLQQHGNNDLHDHVGRLDDEIHGVEGGTALL